ncbi:MAG: transporter substrate-binding domain-containing protein [Chloroflexota bacterium]|jgi:polar amino acid transport system substrate-binding protein
MNERKTSYRLALLTASILILVAVWRVFLPTTPASAQPGNPLRVATKSLEPFVFLNREQPAGFSVDLWEEIARRLDFSFEWIAYETVGEILEAVEIGTADVAIAGISMTREREAVIDFTHPFYDAGLQIMVPARSSFSYREVLNQFRSPGMLVFILIGLLSGLAMANFIYFAERRRNPDFQQGYLRGLWEALWWLLTIVANGEYPDKPTISVTRRLMTIAFWLVGLLLVAQFTASITSALTVQQLTSDIRGPEDLPGKRVATVEGSTSANYLTANNIQFTGVIDIEEAYILMERSMVDAIVYDAPILNYYSVSAGRGDVNIVGSVFKPEKYSIALPTGSPLREQINEVLLAMYQDGTMEQIENRWFSE